MAFAPPSPSSVFLFALVFTVSSSVVLEMVVSQESPVLDSGEVESVYRVLEAVNSEIPWRSLFPDDLCAAGPHGVACDYFTAGGGQNRSEMIHVTELSFGYVSDYSPNPPCTDESTLSPLLFSFRYLRKLFFYKCFAGKNEVSAPLIPASFGSYLEELVFIENPSLVGPFGAMIGNFSRLRRVILTGTGVYGKIPDGLSGLAGIEQITLARNRLTGEIPQSLSKLKKLRVLDLSGNGFEGKIPDSIGGLPEVSKLDLSFNRFNGVIPETLKDLQKMEFLDLSYNRFTNSGIPVFLGEMPNLRELHLSGNGLGGQIPEIWDNLGGILGLGLSGVGLVGNIPSSMGVFLRNLCYLGLDNNRLEGTVPQELGFLESVKEMNLENNKLKGRLPFSSEFTAKVGGKLKLRGNHELCLDEGLRSSQNSSSLGDLKKCKKPHFPNAVFLYSGVSSSIDLAAPQFLIVLGVLFVFP